MFELFMVFLAGAAQSAANHSAPGDSALAAAPAAAVVAPTAPAPAETAMTPAQSDEKPEPTRDVAASPAFPAPKGTPPSTELKAEPQVATGRFLTALEVKPILNATRTNWISVREYGGQDLLYVTHLWSWRCGLLEIRIGLNGAKPEVWPLPECHVDQAAAAAILESDGLPYRTFPLRSVQLIDVQLTYDDLSTDAVRFNRHGIIIP
ncbi:hypothetical protein ACXYMO_04330 [Arenibacterium sp. CAU 1754]